MRRKVGRGEGLVGNGRRRGVEAITGGPAYAAGDPAMAEAAMPGTVPVDELDRATLSSDRPGHRIIR